MTVCFEGFEECVENENMLIDTFMETRYKEINLLWPYFTKHEMKFSQVLSYKTSR